MSHTSQQLYREGDLSCDSSKATASKNKLFSFVWNVFRAAYCMPKGWMSAHGSRKTGHPYCMGQEWQLQWRAGGRAIWKLGWLGFVAKHKAYFMCIFIFQEQGTSICHPSYHGFYSATVPSQKRNNFSFVCIHIFLRYLKTRTAIWIIYDNYQVIMIWFLNTIHTFPDLKGSPLREVWK